MEERDEVPLALPAKLCQEILRAAGAIEKTVAHAATTSGSISEPRPGTSHKESA
jgi:hypothetical protein